MRNPLVSLAEFARQVGVQPRTIKRAINSSDIHEQNKWPLFTRMPNGRYHTTESDIEQWRREHCEGVQMSFPVRDALERVAEGY